MTELEVEQKGYDRLERIFRNLHTYITKTAGRELVLDTRDRVEELDKSLTMGIAYFDITCSDIEFSITVANTFIILIDFPHKYHPHYKKIFGNENYRNYYIYGVAVVEVTDTENNTSGLITSTYGPGNSLIPGFMIPQPPKNIMDTIYPHSDTKIRFDEVIQEKSEIRIDYPEKTLLIGYVAKKKGYYDVVTLALTRHKILLKNILWYPRAFWRKHRVRDLAYALSLVNPEAMLAAYYCSNMQPLDTLTALKFIEKKKIYDEALRILSFYDNVQREVGPR